MSVLEDERWDYGQSSLRAEPGGVLGQTPVGRKGKAISEGLWFTLDKTTAMVTVGLNHFSAIGMQWLCK